MQERQERDLQLLRMRSGYLPSSQRQRVVHIQDVTKNVVESVTNLADGAKKLLEFVGTDVVDSFAGFSDMADSYSNDAGSIDALVTDFSASSNDC